MKKSNFKIAVVGMGYVGLPLAIEFSKKNIEIVGFDINKKRISDLKSAYDYTNEVNKKELKDSKILFTYNLSDLKKCNIFIVTFLPQ